MTGAAPVSRCQIAARGGGSFGRAAGPRQEAAAESRGNGIKKCLSRQTRAARVVVSVFSNRIKLKRYD